MYTGTLSCPSASQYFPLPVTNPHQTVLHANEMFGILKKQRQSQVTSKTAYVIYFSLWSYLIGGIIQLERMALRWLVT